MKNKLQKSLSRITIQVKMNLIYLEQIYLKKKKNLKKNFKSKKEY